MFKRLVPFVLSFCAAATSLPAQRSLIYATINGSVSDSTGAAVPGATVTALESETLTSQSVTSDQSGNFRFAHLPDGQYEVTVHHANYNDIAKTVTVRAGDSASLSMALAATDELSTLPKGQWVFVSPQAPAEHAAGLLPDAPGQHEDRWPGADTIQEFRIISNGLPRALGRSPSGLGLLHGDLYGLSGNNLAELAAVQDLAKLAPTEYGAALGGSTNHNRNAYFLGFDRPRLGVPASSSLLKSLGGRIVAEGPPLVVDSSHTPLTSSQFLARLDHRFSERDTTNIRYNRSSVSGDGLLASGRGLKVTQQSASIDNTIAISPSTVNETRGQFIAGTVQVPGGEPAWGVASGFPTARRFKVYEAADNLSRQFGNQSLRAGGDFLLNQMSVSFLEASLGSASFSQSSRAAGFYAQNQWKMSSDLVLTMGIRYDLEFLRNVHTDTNNLAPQVGFAWSPGGSRSTVIRGGYGMLYEQLPLPAIAGAPEGSASPVNLLRAGTFVLGRNSLPVSALGSFTTVNPSIQNAYVETANLEFEQQFGSRNTLSASYQHIRGVELALPVSSDVALCAAAAGCAAGNEFFSIRQYNSGSRSSYDGLTAAWAGHPVQWGDYRVAYTYADGGGSTYDTFVGDQMRRIAFSGTLHTPFRAGSGLWQDVTHGFTLGAYGDFTRRNELPGLDFIHINAQLIRGFQLGRRTRLELIAQTSDMMEHRNYSTAKAISELGESGATMLSSYARFAAIGTPSGMQAGLRLKF